MEIVIAMAVMSSALLVVLGLLGVGMTTFRQSKGTSISSQIAQQVFSQVQVAPFSSVTNTPLTQPVASGYYRLPNPQPATDGDANIRYYDDQGNETTKAGSIYWVNVSVHIAPPFLGTGLSGSAADNIGLATVTIQVAYNPGGLSPNLNSTTDLWDGTSSGPTLQIYTYSSLLAQGN